MYANIPVAIGLARPDCAQQVLTQAQKLCHSNAAIRLLHILRGPVTLGVRAIALARLSALSDGSDPRGLPVLRDGPVDAQIRAMAKNDTADLAMLANRLTGME